MRPTGAARFPIDPFRLWSGRMLIRSGALLWRFVAPPETGSGRKSLTIFRNQNNFVSCSAFRSGSGRCGPAIGLVTGGSGVGSDVLEKCPSGLRSAPGKCVYPKRVSWVRIPLSPQYALTISVLSEQGTKLGTALSSSYSLFMGKRAPLDRLLSGVSIGLLWPLCLVRIFVFTSP